MPDSCGESWKLYSTVPWPLFHSRCHGTRVQHMPHLQKHSNRHSETFAHDWYFWHRNNELRQRGVDCVPDPSWESNRGATQCELHELRGKRARLFLSRTAISIITTTMLNLQSGLTQESMFWELVILRFSGHFPDKARYNELKASTNQ
jgi:hypothetical protein